MPVLSIAGQFDVAKLCQSLSENVGVTMLISIVDDDFWARDGIADLVTSLGFSVSTFESAEDFLNSDQVTHTLCIITDMKMPGMNGLELQSRLAAQGCATPIIFLTAFPKEKDRVCALKGGAIAFLTKPFKESALRDSIHDALRLR
jgi:FixJ family two-component response regulator